MITIDRTDEEEQPYQLLLLDDKTLISAMGVFYDVYSCCGFFRKLSDYFDSALLEIARETGYKHLRFHCLTTYAYRRRYSEEERRKAEEPKYKSFYDVIIFLNDLYFDENYEGDDADETNA